MNIFESLETTFIANWLIDSLYGYPVMLVLHGIGMSIVIGILFMFNLRLMGLFNNIELGAFKSLLKLAWAGFLINFISGCILFVQKATSFVQNWAFLVKIAGVVIATVMAIIAHKTLYQQADKWNSENAIALSAKILAFVSIGLWSVVIITGRLVGYLEQ
ncbi:MAG: hypothetical protein HN764_07850 [Gammaproteobacteria bacterium]|jgi:hypothetical protein|nr:hypothetical protein [Gammaproteobacteria bacterium]